MHNVRLCGVAHLIVTGNDHSYMELPVNLAVKFHWCPMCVMLCTVFEWEFINLLTSFYICKTCFIYLD